MNHPQTVQNSVDDRKRRSAWAVESSRIKVMSKSSHGDRAMAAALAELDGTAPKTAALLVFFAAARKLRDVYGAEKAAGLAYKVADEFAVRDK